MKKMAHEGTSNSEQARESTDNQRRWFFEGMEIGSERARKASPAALKQWATIEENLRLERVAGCWLPDQLNKDLAHQIAKHGESVDANSFAHGWMTTIAYCWFVETGGKAGIRPPGLSKQ